MSDEQQQAQWNSEAQEEAAVAAEEAEAYSSAAQPNYADISRMIDDAPITWAGGLLIRAVRACKRGKFFASDSDLLSFVANVLKESGPQDTP